MCVVVVVSFFLCCVSCYVLSVFVVMDGRSSV